MDWQEHITHHSDILNGVIRSRENVPTPYRLSQRSFPISDRIKEKH
jgi:hypothetical protein